MQALTAKQYAHLFAPKLFTVLRGEYRRNDLCDDTPAGLTVAVVALPLAMALAIASGTTPEKGWHTANIAGFLISALGGSRVQIGGPTAAFIPLAAVLLVVAWNINEVEAFRHTLTAPKGDRLVLLPQPQRVIEQMRLHPRDGDLHFVEDFDAAPNLAQTLTGNTRGME